MSRHYSAALPIAYVLLRILIVLNWLLGLAILILLVAMPNREWIMSALHLSPSLQTERVIWVLRGIAALGLVGIPLHYFILKRLIAMVETVRRGDPFVPANAERLFTIGWILVALQFIAIVIGVAADTISTHEHPVKIGAGFSLTGWLAVLLTFVLARVFAEGTIMREDLEGTV